VLPASSADQDETMTDEPGRDTDTAGTDQGGNVLPAETADDEEIIDDEPGRDTDTPEND
jgi:hypothetical protein